MRMGVSLVAQKHLVLTTLRETKAQVTPVGDVALTIPSGTKREVVMISSSSVFLKFQSIKKFFLKFELVKTR